MPVEVNLNAYILAKQNDIFAVDYHNLMMDNINKVIDKRMRTLKEIENDKLWVARAYNKKVKGKYFQVGELVSKTILYGPSQAGDHLPNLLLFIPRGRIVFQNSSPT